MSHLRAYFCKLNKRGFSFRKKSQKYRITFLFFWHMNKRPYTPLLSYDGQWQAIELHEDASANGERSLS